MTTKLIDSIVNPDRPSISGKDQKSQCNLHVEAGAESDELQMEDRER